MMRFAIRTGFDFSKKELPRFLAIDIIAKTIDLVTANRWSVKYYNIKKIDYALSNITFMINAGMFDKLKSSQDELVPVFNSHKEGLRCPNHDLHERVKIFRDLMIERFDIGFEETHEGCNRFFVKK